ncbi:MAG: hypothetical protein OCC49_13390 [Fibrobacterales bacterium]
MKHLILLCIFSSLFSACSILDSKSVADTEMDYSSSIVSSSSWSLISSSDQESFSSFLSQATSASSVSMPSQVSSTEDPTNGQYDSSSEFNTPQSSVVGETEEGDPLKVCERILSRFYRLPITHYDKTEIGPYALGKKLPKHETFSGLLAPILLDDMPHDSPDSIISPAFETQTWWDPTHADAQIIKETSLTIQQPYTLSLAQNNQYPFSVPQEDTTKLNDYILNELCYSTPLPLSDTASKLDSTQFIKDSLNCTIKDSLSALPYEEITNHLKNRYKNYTPQTVIYSKNGAIDFFGHYPVIHNYVYTSQFDLNFIHNGDSGQQIIGEADDVLLIYINNHLVFDQLSYRGNVNADTVNLDTFYEENNITLGDTLRMKVFYADLLPTNAILNLEITMSCPLLD